jgi:hypothetical protein
MQHLEASGTPVLYIGSTVLNPLNAELNPICHLLALLGAHPILHVSRIRVKSFLATFDARQPLWHVATHEIINAEGILHASSAHLSNFLHLHV